MGDLAGSLGTGGVDVVPPGYLLSMNEIEGEGIDLSGVSDEVGAVHALDLHNYAEARKGLGDAIDLVSLLKGGFDFLSDGLQGLKEPIDERVAVTGVYFILWCRHQFTMAVTALLRGHRNDALSHIRRGVEGAGFAARIRKHPALAQVWLESRRSAEAFKKYKKKFGTSKIFPKSDQTLSRLREVYETTNPFSHPSLTALAGHSTIVVKEDGGFEATFKYHQFETGDPSDFLRWFLYILQTNRFVLDAFATVFPEAVAADQSVWDLRLNSFDAAFNVYKEEWKSLIVVTGTPADPAVVEALGTIEDDADG